MRLDTSKSVRQITELARLRFIRLFDEELTTASGLDDAIIGVGVRCGQPPIVVYAVDQIIKILMDRDGMTNPKAVEFFEFNIESVWTGNCTPVWMYPISGDDLQVHKGFCSQIVDKSSESLNAIRED